VYPSDDSLQATADFRERQNGFIVYPSDEYSTQRKYDVILVLDVLEHIEDDCSAPDKIHALLKHEATIVMTVPAIKWLWSRHDVANHHFRCKVCHLACQCGSVSKPAIAGDSKRQWVLLLHESKVTS
jgi:hypothetical protein